MDLYSAIWVLLAVAQGAKREQHEIVFAPREGQVLVKTFETSVELRLDRLSSWVESERGSTPWEWSTSLRRVESRRLTWTDEPLRVRNGRVETLRRSFDDVVLRIESSGDAWRGTSGSMANVADARARLTGRTVLFELEDKTYVARAEEGDYVDRDWRAALRADDELLDLLPSRRVSVGDRWRADASTLRSLFAPGGRFEFEERYARSLQLVLEPALLDELNGQLRCELIGVCGKTAVIELWGEAEARSNTVGELTIPLFFVAERAGEGEAKRALEIRIEGRLAWDLEADRLTRLGLRGALVLEVESRLWLNGLKSLAVSSESWSGSFELAAEVAEAERRLGAGAADR